MSSTIRVTLRPRTTLQVSIRPRTRLATVLRTGTRGTPGSDAAVTTENIESALGFSPVSPSSLDSAISSLGLDSASTHAASDFATAAQGAKADTALQDASAFDAAGSAAAVAAASIPLSQKGAANGVATLGSDSRIPSAQLPSYVDDVLEYASLAAFPATGENGKIYTALDTNKIYRWSGSTYIEISPSPGSTDSVTEGSVNLYFTAARAVTALASTLASYATQSWVGSTISSAIAALGLGTASTHAATDFDSAGSATVAQNAAQQYAVKVSTALAIALG